MERSHCPPAIEQGHWIRAPFEVGKPHVDGLRSRLLELQVGDLGEALEKFGMDMEFWLVKDRAVGVPRWVAPVDHHGFTEAGR